MNVIVDPDIAELSLASAKPISVEGLDKKITLSKEDLSSLIKKGRFQELNAADKIQIL